MLYALPFLLVTPAYAQAAPLQAAASGRALEIESPCAKSVTVTVDPSLSGKAVLEAKAVHPEELAQLEFSTVDDQAKLRIRGETCWRAPDQKRSLEVTLHVPDRFPISVEDGGSAEYRLPDTHAPLSLEASGSIGVRAGAVGALNLELSGSGTVDIAQLEGPAHVEISGSGTVAIGGGTIPALDLQASGSGQFRFGSGAIGALNLNGGGNVQVNIGATVGTAAVDLSGSGNARIARVNGPLERSTEGSARLEIGTQ